MLTEQSVSQKNVLFQTVSQQETEEYPIRGRSETVLSKRMCIDTSMSGLENGAIRIYKKVAPSITAREYKDPRMILE